MGSVVNFAGISLSGNGAYLYPSEDGKNIMFRVVDSSGNYQFYNVINFATAINTTLPALINAAKPKVKIVHVSAVATDNGESGTMAFSAFKYYGLQKGSTVMDAVDALMNSGYTILGGWISSGNCNDSQQTSNVPAWEAMISTVSKYYSVPYQWGFYARSYETIHWEVQILYI